MKDIPSSAWCTYWGITPALHLCNLISCCSIFFSAGGETERKEEVWNYLFNLEQLPTQQVRGRGRRTVCFLFVCGSSHLMRGFGRGQDLTSFAPAADPRFSGLGHDNMLKPTPPLFNATSYLTLPLSPDPPAPPSPDLRSQQTQLLIISE